jgi:FAD/FMN-containing dehydrogenase
LSICGSGEFAFDISYIAYILSSQEADDITTQTIGSTGVSTLDGSVLQAFRAQCRGTIIGPNDAGYDTARMLWNGMIDKRPAVIARCTGVADVRAAIEFARTNGLPVAIRGGGHNAAGTALCDGGVVIDLSAMRGIRVDPLTRTVRAQGGVTWGEFDRETQVFGLATTGGAISTTGIAGLTLGGGLGWLMRSYGLACDNLLSADVVTADGQVLTASSTENEDLFWGLRGGGGNFGVVTSLEYQLHPVGPVLGGMVVHPIERARDVLRFYRDFTQAAPDALAVFAGLMTSPEGVRIAAMLTCYNGPIEEGEKALRPLRQFGPPVADLIAPMPYTQQQSLLDDGFPAGLQVYWRSDFLRTLSDEVIDLLVDHFAGVTSPLSAILLEHFGGAVRRVGPDDTAFDHRDADYNLAFISRWPEPGGADPHVAWTRRVHEAVRPHTRGVYVNYLGEEGEDRVKAAYGDQKYQRLVALKNKYDPTNFFRSNQNIRPAL